MTTESETAAVNVLVYSDDSETRRAVVSGIGKRLGKEFPQVFFTEAATRSGALENFENNPYDLLILDGETAKIGGMAFARQLQEEFDEVPPIIILTARPQDDWLAQWSGAVATVSEPISPIDLQETVVQVLRGVRG